MSQPSTLRIRGNRGRFEPKWKGQSQTHDLSHFFSANTQQISPNSQTQEIMLSNLTQENDSNDYQQDDHCGIEKAPTFVRTWPVAVLRNRCNHLIDLNPLFEDMMERKMKPLSYWAQHVLFSSDVEIKKVKFATFKAKLKIFFTNHSIFKKLFTEQTKRVALPPDQWRDIVLKYLTMAAQPVKAYVNLTDYYDGELVKEPFDNVPSYDDFASKVSRLRVELEASVPSRVEILPPPSVDTSLRVGLPQSSPSDSVEISGSMFSSFLSAGKSTFVSGTNAIMNIFGPQSSLNRSPEVVADIIDSAVDLGSQNQKEDEVVVTTHVKVPDLVALPFNTTQQSDVVVGSLTQFSPGQDPLQVALNSRPLGNKLLLEHPEWWQSSHPDQDQMPNSEWNRLRDMSIIEFAERYDPSLTKMKDIRLGSLDNSMDNALYESSKSNGGGKFDVKNYLIALSMSSLQPSKKQLLGLQDDTRPLHLSAVYVHLHHSMLRVIQTLEANLHDVRIAELVAYPKLYLVKSSSRYYFEIQHQQASWKSSLCALIGSFLHPTAFLINDVVAAMLISFQGPSKSWATTELLSLNVENNDTFIVPSKEYCSPTYQSNCDIPEFLRLLKTDFIGTGMNTACFHSLCCSLNLAQSEKSSASRFYIGCSALNLHDFSLDRFGGNSWIFSFKSSHLQTSQQYSVMFYLPDEDLYGAYDPLRGFILGRSLVDAGQYLLFDKMLDGYIFHFKLDNVVKVSEALNNRLHSVAHSTLKLGATYGLDLDHLRCFFVQGSTHKGLSSDTAVVVNNYLQIIKSESKKRGREGVKTESYSLTTRLHVFKENVELGPIFGLIKIFLDENELVTYIAQNKDRFPFLFDVTKKIKFTLKKFKYVILDTKDQAMAGVSIASFADRIRKQAMKTSGVKPNVRIDFSQECSDILVLISTTKITKGSALVVDPSEALLIDNRIYDLALQLLPPSSPVRSSKVMNESVDTKQLWKNYDKSRNDLSTVVDESCPVTAAQLAERVRLFSKVSYGMGTIPFEYKPNFISCRYQSLSPGNKAMVEAIWSFNIEGELADKTFQIISNTVVTYGEFKALHGSNWLNNVVINLYLQMLSSRNITQVTGAHPRRCHSFCTTFFSYMFLWLKTYSYERVKNSTNMVDIYELDKLFIPINIGNTHWTLLVLCMQLKEVHYFDSMGDSKNTGPKFNKLILNYLNDDAHARLKPENTFVQSQWKFFNWKKKSPQQTNGFDCGVFVCMTADFLYDDLPLIFEQSDMKHFRSKIANSFVLDGNLGYILQEEQQQQQQN
jgi:hypothetical protein